MGKGPRTCLSWETTGLPGESGLLWVLAFRSLGESHIMWSCKYVRELWVLGKCKPRGFKRVPNTFKKRVSTK